MEKEHSAKCASHTHKYDGDARNKFGSEKKECDCDSYHTFKELYDHRTALFAALCVVANTICDNDPKLERMAWRAKLHHDGTMFEGMFIAGIGGFNNVDQVTYHIENEKWDLFKDCDTLDRAPEYDGHTSDDVLERLKHS